MKFKIIASVILTAVFAAPPYIKKCSKSDEEVNKCILESIKHALPQIMKGDASLLIPNLNTYSPDDQQLSVGEITYTLKNIKHDSGVLSPKYANMDFTGKSLEIGMFLPYLLWKADFVASGKNGGKDIQITGRANVSFEGVQFNYTKHFKEVELEGNTIYQIKSDDTKGKIDKLTVTHEYNDNTVNKAELDGLLPEIETAVGERLKLICSQLVTYAMEAVLKTIPKDEIFLP